MTNISTKKFNSIVKDVADFPLETLVVFFDSLEMEYIKKYIEAKKSKNDRLADGYMNISIHVRKAKIDASITAESQYNDH